MPHEPGEDRIRAMAQILLEKHAYRAQFFATQEALSRGDVEVSAMLDRMMERALIKIRQEIYAHKLAEQEVRVPFEKSELLEWPGMRAVVLAYVPIVVAGCVATIAFNSIPAFLVMCVAVLALVCLHAMTPARAVTAKGEVVVHRTRFNKLPEAQIPPSDYPEEFGTIVPLERDRTDVYYDE